MPFNRSGMETVATNTVSTPAPATTALDKRDWIAGLEKGLSVIEAFDAEHARLTASQAGQRCGLTRTAARRYLLTLSHLGYVATDGKLFWLTPRVLRLGQSYLDSARLPRTVQPFLQRVTAGTQETAYVAVLDGDDVVYIARSGTHRNLHNGYGLGTRVQAQVTAAGMAILAMQGGRDFTTSPFNRALEGIRPLGTAFLPLVYAAALTAQPDITDAPQIDGPLDNKQAMIGGLTGTLGEWGAEGEPVAYTGTTSMNIAVEVRSGDMKNSEMQKNTECLIVFVSVDDEGRPMPVPAWAISTCGRLSRRRGAKVRAACLR